MLFALIAIVILANPRKAAERFQEMLRKDRLGFNRRQGDPAKLPQQTATLRLIAVGLILLIVTILLVLWASKQ